MYFFHVRLTNDPDQQTAHGVVIYDEITNAVEFAELLDYIAEKLHEQVPLATRDALDVTALNIIGQAAEPDDEA